MSGIDYSWVTPELAKNPGVASDVSKSSDPSTNSVLASQSLNGVTAHDVVAEHQTANDSTGFWTKAGIDVFKGLNFLAKPLQEVQRDYKFIHSVFTKQGVGAGFLATLGTVAGGAIGSVLGPEGTMLGAELGSSLSRKLVGGIYTDSYKDSEDPNYKISAGRDFSNLIGSAASAVGAKGIGDTLKNTNSGIGKFVSGITDATADVTTDPVSLLGKFSQLMKSGKYLTVTDGELASTMKYPLAARIPAVRNFLDNTVTDALGARSGRVFTPQQLDAVREGGGITNPAARGYNAALDDMENIIKTSANKDIAAGTIAQKYPTLGTVAPAKIAELSSADDIHNFMRDTLYFGELSGSLAGSAVLPSRTLLRAKGLEPIQKVLRGDASPEEMNWVNKGYKTFSGYMPFSIDPVTKQLSTQSFRWDSPDATSVIYRIARFGMGHTAATEMAGQYAAAVAAGDIGLARSIKLESTMNAFIGMGIPDDNLLVTNVRDELGKLNNPIGAGEVYASDATGNAIGKYQTLDGRVATAGVSEHQFVDEFSIPNFQAAKKEFRAAGNFAKNYYGKLDSFTAKAYTNSIFKPLALATLGFGTRVAAAELIPAVARYGVTNMIKSKLSASLAKQGELLPGEGSHLAAASLVALGAAKGIPADAVTSGFPTCKSSIIKGMAKIAPEDQVGYAIDLLRTHDGHILPDAVGTGHAGSASTRYDMSRAADQFFQQESRKYKYRELPDFTTYQADSPHYLPSYYTSLNKEAKIAKGKNIANDITDVMGGTKKLTLEKEVGTIAKGSEGYSEAKQYYYRETSPDALITSLATTEGPGSRQWFATDKDLALGQGNNNGVMIHYDINAHKTSDNRMAKFEASNKKKDAMSPTGDSKERELFVSGKSLLSNADKIDFTPEAWNYQNRVSEFLSAGGTEVRYSRSLIQTLEKAGFELKENPDGGVSFIRAPKVISNNKFERYQSMREELINREYQRIMDTKAGNYGPYKREASLGQRWNDQDPRQFAADRVDSILGLTVGKDGTVHHEIAQAMAEGKVADFDKIKDINVQKLPATIPGHQVEAYIPSKENLLNVAVNLGFNKLIDPVINNLSREPLYLVHFSNEMESLKYLEQTGGLTHDQAIRIAEYRAVHAMLPQIHNTALRTQFSQLAQNYMPFYFAQEQSIKRAYRAAKDTGMAGPVISRSVRQYQMVEQVMNNPTFVQTDANGNSYAYLPMVGEFGKSIQKVANALGWNMVAGLPISAQGSMTSLKSVVPGLDLPGVGPIAAIAGNLVENWFPHLAPALNTGLGQSAGRSVWESLLPSKPVLNVWNALGPDGQNAALTNAITGALASAYYHQDELRAQGIPVPTDSSTTMEKEAFIDRIRNNAKSILLVKAVTGLLSPLSPRVEQTDIGFSDEFSKLVKSTGNYNDALLKFLKEHGDKAVSYTVAKTSSAVRGASFPYTNEAINWIEDNKNGLLADPNKSTGAMFLIPEDPGPGNTLAIHQQLIREHLRTARTPLEFLNQFYIAQGNNTVAPYLADHTAKVNEYKQMQNSYMLQQENQNWSAFLGQMKVLQPTWYENYTNGYGRNNAALAVQQLQNIFADPKTAPNTTQAQLVKGLLSDYNNHMNTMNQYKQMGITGQIVQMESQNWSTYLENLKASDPRLTSVINTVFSKVG